MKNDSFENISKKNSDSEEEEELVEENIKNDKDHLEETEDKKINKDTEIDNLKNEEKNDFETIKERDLSEIDNEIIKEKEENEKNIEIIKEKEENEKNIEIIKGIEERNDKQEIKENDERNSGDDIIVNKNDTDKELIEVNKDLFKIDNEKDTEFNKEKKIDIKEDKVNSNILNYDEETEKDVNKIENENIEKNQNKQNDSSETEENFQNKIQDKLEEKVFEQDELKKEVKDKDEQPINISPINLQEQPIDSNINNLKDEFIKEPDNKEDVLDFFEAPKKVVKKPNLTKRVIKKKEIKEEDEDKLEEEPDKKVKKPALKRKPLKKPAQNNLDEQPLKSAQNNLDEQPLKSAQNNLDEQPLKPAQNNLDEQPLKPAQNNLDEQPLKPAQNNLDEQPLKPAQNNLDEPPLNNSSGQTGEEEPVPKPSAYNFDSLGADAYPPGYNLNSLNADAYPPGFNPNDMQKELEETLEMKIKSSDATKKAQAYEELIKWEDPSYTREIFTKELHILIKEKNTDVIPLMIMAIESLFEGERKREFLEKLILTKFMESLTEHLITNAVKKPKSKKAIMDFIPKFFDVFDDKTGFKDEMKNLLGKIKMKIQENVFVIILTLIKAGKIIELDNLNLYWPFLEKFSSSRTAAIKNVVMKIYMETFLYLGDGLRANIKNLKKPELDELEKYFASVDPKDMKTLKSKDGKVTKYDAYEFAKEEDLPKEYQEEDFVEELLKLPKWTEKKMKLEECINALKKIVKLNPKTTTRHFIQLTNSLFLENIVLNQVLSLKIIGLLGGSMRTAFTHEAKQIFPLLLTNLKIKNRQLTDQILETSEKLFHCINFEDVSDDFKENFKGKNNYKVLNLLLMIEIIIDKTEKVKTPQTAVKIVKMILFLIDGSDLKVRDKASQIIAKLKDNYDAKVQPLLTDLNSQKMSKILKYCTNPQFKIKPDEEKKEVENEEDKKNKKGKDRTQRNNVTKSNKIAQMRENLFSNKTIKISETTEFSKFLETNLKNLAEMTKDFKEVSSSQCKEILLLIDEICLKVSKKAFIQFSREVIAKFYIEQICAKYTDEIYESIIRYLSSKNKLVNTHIFLGNMFDVISDKSIKVTRDLLLVIVKIMERGLANKGNLRTINHKSFVEFLKNNFTSQTVHSSLKSIIVNLMRTLHKSFGDKVLVDYPSSIIKDFEVQNKEIEKNFTKTLERLNDKNVDKKKNALMELSNLTDITKITLYWNTKDFLSYLRKELINETQGTTLKYYVKIVLNYLDIYKKSKNDFSLKNYLFVFHAIISQYYDQNNKKELRNPEKQGALEEIFNKTVQELTATLIFNSLISDTNALSWKEQILHFYLQYGSEIDVKVKFITFIISLINSNYGGEVKTLLDNALLMLKNTDNDEIIIKGNENREIRSIWQKKEEDVLFEERYIRGNKVFEDISFYNAAKIFIEQTLKMEGFSFYDKNIESIKLLPNDPGMKIKLAYFYLRSIENISFISLHIFQEIRKINLNLIKPDCKLMALKILINLLKNNYCAFEEPFYQNIKERFLAFYNNVGYNFEPLVRMLNLIGFEITFLEIVLNNEEGNQIQPSAINSPRKKNTNQTMNNTSVIQSRTPIMREKEGHSQIDSQSYHTINNQFKKTRQNQKIVEESSQGDNKSYSNFGGGGLRSNNAPQEFSPRSLSKQSHSRRNFTVNVIQTQDDPVFILDEHFRQLLTFDLECYKYANDYFDSLMNNQQGIEILKNQSDKIILHYENIVKTIFDKGINYEIDKNSYELIFQPLLKFWNLPGFLESLSQDSLNLIVEQLLLRLVLANNEKVIREKMKDEEVNISLATHIVQSFNKLILRIIENANINNLFTSFFKVIFECKNGKADKLLKSIDNLAFKCIMRILKSIKKYVEKIDCERVFILIYQFYEQNFRLDANEAKTINKTFGVLIKKIISYKDIDEVIECYENAFGDMIVPYILDPIKQVQEKIGYSENVEQEKDEIRSERSIGESDKKMLEIIEAINSEEDGENINHFIQEIKNLLLNNPGLNFESFSDYFDSQDYYKYVYRELQNSLNGRKNSNHMDEYFNKSNMDEVSEYSKRKKRGYR